MFPYVGWLFCVVRRVFFSHACTFVFVFRLEFFRPHTSVVFFCILCVSPFTCAFSFRQQERFFFHVYFISYTQGVFFSYACWVVFVCIDVFLFRLYVRVLSCVGVLFSYAVTFLCSSTYMRLFSYAGMLCFFFCVRVRFFFFCSCMRFHFIMQC